MICPCFSAPLLTSIYHFTCVHSLVPISILQSLNLPLLLRDVTIFHSQRHYRGVTLSPTAPMRSPSLSRRHRNLEMLEGNSSSKSRTQKPTSYKLSDIGHSI